MEPGDLRTWSPGRSDVHPGWMRNTPGRSECKSPSRSLTDAGDARTHTENQFAGDARTHTPRASLVVCCTADGKKSSLWVGEFGCWLLKTSKQRMRMLPI